MNNITQASLKALDTLSNPDYRAQVTSCWLGKAVGGTLGMPFEGVNGPLDLHYYTPVPTEMLPNDDLDLQVVWACVLDRMDDVRVDRHILAQAWLDHVEFPWDEYGVALRNLKNGLQPPLSGSFDNWFTNGMGAPIRSELWACLAPGNPEIAAAYAYEDACVDHAGEGIWGEVFLAALESAAFVESDPHILLGQALAYLPESSLIRHAVADTERWWNRHPDWRAVREEILRSYGHENFTDATMNIAFTVLGWLAGAGDFSRAICIAVNCGKDTDCTGATVGALMGIIDPDCIPDRWLAPIGRSLVISPGIKNLDAPGSLDDFTRLIVDLRGRLSEKAPAARAIGKYTGTSATDALAVVAEVAFADVMPTEHDVPNLEAPQLVTFAGTVGSLKRQDFDKEILLLRYRFNVPSPGDVRVMFNIREESRVWIDDVYAFGRGEGCMAPSLHRAPKGQMAVVTLTAGGHELIAVVRRPEPGRDAEWVIGIGDGKTAQWFPKALLASEHGRVQS